jgi:hypothetical protein
MVVMYFNTYYKLVKLKIRGPEEGREVGVAGMIILKYNIKNWVVEA